MHNIMKKGIIIATLAASACFLSACGSGVVVHEVDKSYSTDTILVDAKIPKLSGLSSQSLQESVNREYEKKIMHLLEDFTKDAKSTGDLSTFTVTTTCYHNQNGFFSAVTQVDMCKRSAHKSSNRIVKNIDTQKCVEVALSELFEDDAYIDMINARIDEHIKANPDKYADLWEKPSITPEQKYYIDGGNLVLFYSPYELSYYERGFVEIPLSLADMSGYLKQEYRTLAGD